MRYLGCIGLFLLAACDAVPVQVPNDTMETVLIDDHDRRFANPLKLEVIRPNQSFGARYCWKETDAIFLATKAYRDPVVFDPRDFCDPDECDCDIPVSKLVRQMTPRGVLKRQQDICAGRGPFLLPGIRAELCAIYGMQSAPDKAAPLSSLEANAMLAR